MKRHLAALEASFRKLVPDYAWQWEAGTGGLGSSPTIPVSPLPSPQSCSSRQRLEPAV